MNDSSADVTPATARPDGRRSRWTAHRAARRDELIDATIRAIGRYGAGVGMDQIAAVAHTSKPVIYRYFHDKDDLYRAVTERVVGRILDSLRAVTAGDLPPRELIHASVDAYLGLLEQNPELYRFVAQHPLPDTGTAPRQGGGEAAMATAFSGVVADLLGQHLARRLDAAGRDPALAHPWGAAIVGFISAASLWWLDHRDAMSRLQLGDHLSELLWSGAAGVLPVD